MKALIQKIIDDEMRNNAGRPQKYQLLDFIGAAYGFYFLQDGWKSQKMLNVFIGSTMVYIHTLRFWYAPQGGEPPTES